MDVSSGLRVLLVIGEFPLGVAHEPVLEVVPSGTYNLMLDGQYDRAGAPASPTEIKNDVIIFLA